MTSAGSVDLDSIADHPRRPAFPSIAPFSRKYHVFRFLTI